MTTDSSERLVLLNRLADEFAARHRQGERPSLEEYNQRHPELADDIRKFFPAMVRMEQIKDDRRDVPEPAAGPLPALGRLGDYRIIREIGRGGMGVVYEAEQVSLGRHVALKVLPQQRLADAHTRHRFEREAKAAARLHHTNIVPVFGVGEYEGLPYYAMQYIQGLGLDQVLEELKQLQPVGHVYNVPLSARHVRNVPHGEVSAADVARLLMTGEFVPAAAEADMPAVVLDRTVDEAAGTPIRAPAGVHAPSTSRLAEASALSSSSVVLPGAARSAGQKPFTYWQSVALIGAQVADALDYAHRQGVQHRDIKPSNLLLDTCGTVWVTDFGLARADNEDHLTQTGDIVGTLRYMPPEAFEGKTDARSDIYSLGLTLYELLALRPAFDAGDRHRLIKQVTTAEAPRLDALNPAIPRDLVTIVGKATDREPGRRYATAGELAADLQRFVADEPILARRQTQLERYWRWARRNPGIAVLGGVLTAVLVAVTVASLLAAGHFNRLRHNEAQTAQQERDTRHEVELSQKAAEESADESRRRGDAERWQRYRANIAAAGSALQLPSSCTARRALAAAPAEYRDWEWLHFFSRLDEARLVLPAGLHVPEVNGVAFRPDGKQVAATGEGDDGTVRVWDAATGGEVGVLDGHGRGWVRALAFSPDGRRLLVFFGDGTLLSWVPATNDRQVLLRIPYETLLGDTFSPDHRLLVGVKGTTLQLWDVSAGRKRADLPGRITGGNVCAAAFSPDSRNLAYSADGNALRLWDVKAGAESSVLRGHSDYIRALAFSPDGKRLASGSADPDNSVRLWDVASGKELAVLRGHRNEVISVAFSPDGSRLASASRDQTARLWDGVTGRPIATLPGHRDCVNHVVFRPDSRRLVTNSYDATLRLWDAAAGEPLAVLNGHAGRVWLAVFKSDGAALASIADDGTVRLWDMALAERSGILRGHTSYVYDVAFSSDGSRAASAAWDGTVRLWDPTSCLQTSVLQHALLDNHGRIVTGVCFRPDGKQLVSANGDGNLRVWDAVSGRLLRTLRHPGGNWRQYPRAAFHPNGTMLAAGGTDGVIRLWGAEGDDPVALLRGHESIVGDVAFRSDGVQLASAGVDKTVRLWDVASRKPVAVLRGHTGIVHRVAYSADGRLLTSASDDKTARLWDAATGALLAVLPHGSIVYGVAFNPGGTRLAAACADNTIRLWDVGVAKRAGGKAAPEAEVAELRGHTDYVHAVDWSPDGTRLISASGDGTVRVWDSLSPRVRARPANAYVPPRGYVCYRATDPIALDGKLDDAAWKAAPWTDDFVDIEGDRRIKPRFRTRAKMLWDDNYLYLAAELEEAHVQGTYTKR
ncbi:MAG: protein kinase domain-containing protein, partial [Gemmataceae bacterium]